MILKNKINKALGPHEGKELELMLKNEKELSLFYTDSEIPEEFIPYLEEGRFFLKTLKFKKNINGVNFDFKYYIISQHKDSSNVCKLSKVLELNFNNSFSPDLEREIGILLGYNNDDIEYYIQHWLKNSSN